MFWLEIALLYARLFMDVRMPRPTLEVYVFLIHNVVPLRDLVESHLHSH